MATAPPPSCPIEWTWPAKSRPPLELQLLPPSPFAASESPWGIDPSRLQQLMMGTCTASSVAVTGLQSPSTDLGALFDGRGSLQPLPTGWERCLDLQSGKVFLKQSGDGASRALLKPCKDKGKDGRSRGLEASRMDVEQRQDWSLRWLMEGDKTDQHAVNKKSSSIASCRHDVIIKETPITVLDGEPVCLDLDLRLTNGKRSKPSCINIHESEGVPLSAPLNCNVTAGQSWKWQQQDVPFSTGEKPSGSDRMNPNPTINLEKAKECSMVTAVCTKCLMYVLLRRSKAVCPRCSLPIMIEGTPATSSVSRKRPLLEFPTDSVQVDCWEL